MHPSKGGWEKREVYPQQGACKLGKALETLSVRAIATHPFGSQTPIYTQSPYIFRVTTGETQGPKPANKPMLAGT